MVYILMMFVVPTIFFGGLISKMQTATLWAGKMIAPKGFDKEYPNGFQEAITPGYLNNANTLLVVSYLAILILGTMEAWYLGLVLFTITVLMQLIIAAFLPKKASVYLKWVMINVAQIIIFNKKSKNIVQSNIATEMYKKLETLAKKAEEKNLRLPSIDEINKTPLGGY